MNHRIFYIYIYISKKLFNKFFLKALSTHTHTYIYNVFQKSVKSTNASSIILFFFLLLPLLPVHRYIFLGSRAELGELLRLDPIHARGRGLVYNNTGRDRFPGQH